MRSVLLVEDDDKLRNSFARAISASGDFSLVAAVSGVSAAKAAFDLHRPDVALIDLGLPDGSGIDVIRHISQASMPEHECLTMVVSVFGDEKHVVESIAAGAAGYVLKDTADDRFLAAVRDLVAGGAPISPGIARHLLKEVRRNTSPPAGAPEHTPNDGGLSEREREILNLTAKGYTFPEIARLLEISVETIKTHVKRVYQKLAVHSKGEAVYEAQRLGILRAPGAPPRP